MRADMTRGLWGGHGEGWTQGRGMTSGSVLRVLGRGGHDADDYLRAEGRMDRAGARASFQVIWTGVDRGDWGRNLDNP